MANHMNLLLFIASILSAAAYAAQPIQHDAEHYILLDQHKDQWIAEDRKVGAQLEEIQKRNNGKTPNIIYIGNRQ